MRSSMLLLLLSSLALSPAMTASAAPPKAPFGQTSTFTLNTNRIGFADATPLAFTSALDSGGLPRAIALSDPQPNPFNPMAVIPFSVGRRGAVELGICDMRGRLVRHLTSGLMTEGIYSEQWDGSDDAGSMVPTGVYLVHVKLDDVVETRKISLVK